ncbi:hypothetical protein ACHAPK_011670 [Fusarium culmorum]
MLAENASNQVNTLGPNSSKITSHAGPTLISSAHNEINTTNYSAGRDVFCSKLLDTLLYSTWQWSWSYSWF